VDKDLQKGIDEIKDFINGEIVALKESTESDAAEKNEALQNALGKWEESEKAQKQSIEDMQKQYDEMALLQKEYTDNKHKINVTPYEYFKNELTDNKAFDRYKDDKSNFNMQVKADILVSTLYSGNVIEQDRMPAAPFAAPHEQFRVRSLFVNGSTQSDTITYVRQTANTASAAAVAEAGTKAQSDETLTLKPATVEVIAHLFDISNQALNDYAQMATYLSSEGVAGLKDAEDNEILNGSGSSPHLNGIITQAATTFAGGTDISGDTDIDTLVRAYWQLKGLNYNPSFIMVPVAKMRDIQLIKESGGAYIYPNFAPTGLGKGNGAWAINGVPVLTHGKMPSDTFLIADGSRATVWDREQVNIRMSESHATNFAENLTSIRIEERLAFAFMRPDAAIAATFTDAQSTLT